MRPQVHALEHWRRERGQAFCTAEATSLRLALSHMFGQYLLNIGLLHQPALTHCRIRCHWQLLDESWPSDASPPTLPALRGHAWQLPVASGSLDAIVLCHALESIDHVDATLDEASRALIAHGHLLITGFNPLCPWNWPRRIPGLLPALWRCAPRDPQQLRQRLQRRGFEALLLHYHHAPLKHCPTWSHPLWRHGLGMGYLLLLRKHVSIITPLRPRWHPRRTLGVEGVLQKVSKPCSPIAASVSIPKPRDWKCKSTALSKLARSRFNTDA